MKTTEIKFICNGDAFVKFSTQNYDYAHIYCDMAHCAEDCFSFSNDPDDIEHWDNNEIEYWREDDWNNVGIYYIYDFTSEDVQNLDVYFGANVTAFKTAYLELEEKQKN